MHFAGGRRMPARQIDKSGWRVYCDRLSKQLVGSLWETATASLVVNHEVVAEWLPLLGIGITYEPQKDVLEITLRDLDHRVRRPQILYADEGPQGVAGLEIIDVDSLRHTLTLSKPLKLAQEFAR
jgi:hypothetical protein